MTSLAPSVKCQCEVADDSYSGRTDATSIPCTCTQSATDLPDVITLVVLQLLFASRPQMMWLSPGEKAHKQEFWDAWRQRHPGEPPMGTFKTWYRTWLRTKVSAADWLDANTGSGPPAGTVGPSGGSGGTQV
jgi:hypothetical protein